MLPGPPPRPRIIEEEERQSPAAGTRSPLTDAWRLHDEAERRYLGHEVTIVHGASYFRHAPGTVCEDEDGQAIHGYCLTQAPGARRVTVTAVNVDTRASLTEPTVYLRFDDRGQSAWVRAEQVEDTLRAGRRARLSPLAG